MNRNRQSLAEDLFLRNVDLSDEQNSIFRRASNIYGRRGDFEKAVLYAKKAAVAEDNTSISRVEHLEHLADMMRMAGNFDAARETINGVLSQDPDRFTAFTINAAILLACQEFEDAKISVLKAIELGDQRHSTYRLASNVYNRLSDYESSVVYAEKALEAEDNTARSRLNHLEHLASMSGLTGDFDAALAVIDTVLSLDPDRFTAYAAKASIVLANQEFEDAKVLVLKAIELGDERHSTYRLASNIFNRLSDFQTSVLYAQKAVEAKDNTSKSRNNHLEHLVTLLIANGELEAALEKVDYLLSEDPDRFSIYTTKASILLANRELEEAKVLVLKAIELGDERHSTYRLVSNIFIRLGDFMHAVEYAQKAIKATDNTSTSRINHLEHLAISLKASRELKEALRTIDVVLLLDKNRSSACLTKANILLEMGELEEDALWLIEKAIFTGDRRPSTYRKASELCRRIDDDEGAEMFAKKAIEAHDNNDVSRTKHPERLATSLKESGDLEDALLSGLLMK